MRVSNTIILTGLALFTSVNAIVHGDDATSLEYPSIAGIFSSGWTGDSLVCGGVVIGEHTVLTTASCADGSSASSLKIRVGSADRTSGGSFIPVSKLIIHPSYSSSTMDNDYAILHLGNSALAIPGVTSASLPNTNAATTDDLPLRIAG